MREPTYSMTQLQGETGLSYTQIRKYIRVCHLPPALTKGMYACYPRATLDGLRVVMECLEGNRTLRDICDVLHQEPDDDGDDPDRA